jgi:hypothetical protein
VAVLAALLHEEIGLGDDPDDEPGRIDDRDPAHAVLDHQPGHVLERRLGLDRDDFLRHHVADLEADHRRAPAGTGRYRPILGGGCPDGTDRSARNDPPIGPCEPVRRAAPRVAVVA